MYRQVSKASWDKDCSDIIINTEGEIVLTEEDAELFFKNIPTLTEEIDMDNQKLYMNIHTGSVDTYEGWEYEDEEGNVVNGVDLGGLVEVQLDLEGNYVEV